tara:strand:- start:401 stop:670 length:270 start_codon:yes stop_codon:yes gene_type:complete
MESITMHKTELLKNPDTKTTYFIKDEASESITTSQYYNLTKDDTLKWFRRLGGSETAERSYTCRGYNVTKLTSTSPNREIKIIRKFKFQ